MASKKKKNIKTGASLHPKNRHQGRYDLEALAKTSPELKKFIVNVHDKDTIEFAKPQAVKALNKALLMHYYDLESWDIPAGYLCPPIPGRADYIHHIAELMANGNNGKTPEGSKITALDVGVGASCIYPIIGNKEYGWTFIGSELEKGAIKSAASIITENPVLHQAVVLRKQTSDRDVFKGIIEEGEVVDVTCCNPPFHASAEEATAGTQRKVNALKTNLEKAEEEPTMNFGGKSNELWCFGGEKSFITNMIYQSKHFEKQVMWFTSLVSKQDNLKEIYKVLEKVEAYAVKTIPIGTGNKRSRIVAWTFLDIDQQETWAKARWK